VDYMICICGDEVAVPHKGCLALMTEKEKRAWERSGSMFPVWKDPYERDESNP
jgi:hypothetical protein